MITYHKKDLKGRIPDALYEPLPEIIHKRFDSIGLKDFSIQASSLEKNFDFDLGWIQEAINHRVSFYSEVVLAARLGHVLEQLKGSGRKLKKKCD